ncbi:MAG: DNA polymerase III subunit epsilon [Parvibaculales bacterium]
MREIILDTETTGLDPENGDRIVEISCLELVNRLPSNQNFHSYINPECAMSPEAEKIHGLNSAFLADKPLFADIAEAFLQFIGDAPLIIHNAVFDIKFLNAELARVGLASLEAHPVRDTLAMARRKFPGAPASLDALCRRFGVDNSARDVHGAQIDCQLLAAVYLELSGGRQPGLQMGDGDAPPPQTHNMQANNRRAKTHSAPITGRTENPATLSKEALSEGSGAKNAGPQKRRPTPLPARLTPAENSAHKAFLENLPQPALWLKATENGDEG